MDTEPQLHLVLTPSLERLRACCAQLGPQDGLILLDQGVVLVPAVASALPKGFFGTWAASQADLAARGLAAPEAVAQIDDGELVRQVMRYQHTLSWS